MKRLIIVIIFLIFLSAIAHAEPPRMKQILTEQEQYVYLTLHTLNTANAVVSIGTMYSMMGYDDQAAEIAEEVQILIEKANFYKDMVMITVPLYDEVDDHEALIEQQKQLLELIKTRIDR